MNIHTHRSNRILRRTLLTRFQTGRLKCDNGRFVSHVPETAGQRFVLRTQIGETERLKPRLAHLHLVEGAFRLRACVFAQSARQIQTKYCLLVVTSGTHSGYTYAIIRSRFLKRLSMSGIDSDFSRGALLLNSNMLRRLSCVFLSI